MRRTTRRQPGNSMKPLLQHLPRPRRRSKKQLDGCDRLAPPSSRTGRRADGAKLGSSLTKIAMHTGDGSPWCGTPAAGCRRRLRSASGHCRGDGLERSGVSADIILISTLRVMSWLLRQIPWRTDVCAHAACPDTCTACLRLETTRSAANGPLGSRQPPGRPRNRREPALPPVDVGATTSYGWNGVAANNAPRTGHEGSRAGRPQGRSPGECHDPPSSAAVGIVLLHCVCARRLRWGQRQRGSADCSGTGTGSDAQSCTCTCTCTCTEPCSVPRAISISWPHLLLR
ncbi:MAG: hypothetical protein RLZZ618_2788 [Pseudomonadota bacterium]